MMVSISIQKPFFTLEECANEWELSLKDLLLVGAQGELEIGSFASMSDYDERPRHKDAFTGKVDKNIFVEK